MAARRPHGLVYGLLAGSLALNLVGVGYLGYVNFRSKPPRNIERTIDYIAERYPDPVADAVHDRLEKRRDQLEQAFRAMRAARRAIRDALSADPMDLPRAEAAFADSREKASEFQRIIHGAVIEAMPGLTSQDRAKIDRSAGD